VAVAIGGGSYRSSAARSRIKNGRRFTQCPQRCKQTIATDFRKESIGVSAEIKPLTMTVPRSECAMQLAL